MINFICIVVFFFLLRILNRICIGPFRSWQRELLYAGTVGFLLEVLLVVRP